MATLPPPPIYDSELTSLAWQEWFRQVRTYLVSPTGSISWSSVSKEDSNINQIVNRSHQDLQTLQGGGGGDYYHLTGTQHGDLTDGTSSTLHYHASDRDSANFTGTSWSDLTDGNDSTLHYHAADRNSANFTGTNWTDLTDGGDTTLHKHDGIYPHITGSVVSSSNAVTHKVPVTIGGTTYYVLLSNV
jgi:hypothetical protein